MAGFDNLLKGLSAFKQGMQQFHASGAIREANQQLQELNASGLDLEDQLLEERQLGNELALRLAQTGASAQDIQAATGGLGVSANVAFQAEATKELVDQKNDLQQELNKVRFERTKELQVQQEAAEKANIATQQAAATARTVLTTEAALGAAETRVAGAIAIETQKQVLERKKRLIKGTLDDPEFEGIPSVADLKKTKDAIQETRKLLPALGRLKDQFAEFGDAVFNREARASMVALATQLKLIFKSEAFAGLGVIAGVDEELLDNVISDPSVLEKDSTTRARFLEFGKIVNDSVKAAAARSGKTIDPSSDLGKDLSNASTPSLRPETKRELNALFAQSGPALEAEGLNQETAERILRDTTHPQHKGLVAFLVQQGFISLGRGDQSPLLSPPEQRQAPQQRAPVNQPTLFGF